MIKVIYGVKDNGSVCELIYPEQDKIGISSLVNQSIMKNDINEAFVGEYFYSIQCIGVFFIFSKINIVYEKSKRVSYRAFMIILEEQETKCNVLDELSNLESKYIDKDEIKQSGKIPNRIEISNDTKQKQVIITYYNNNNIESYFANKRSYKQYDTIYFINDIYKNREEDPINVLKHCDKIVSIDELISNDIYHDETETESELKGTVKQILKNRLLIFLFGFLIGIGGLWEYQNLFSNKNIIEKTEQQTIQEYKNRQNSNDENDNKNKKLKSEVKLHEDSTYSEPTEGDSAQTGSIINNEEGEVSNSEESQNIETEIDNFLKNDCKTMTLDSLINKITVYTKNTTINKNKLRLKYFADFIVILKQNPVNKDGLNRIPKDKLNNDYEYVRFYKYLISKDSIFFNNKKLDMINNYTLEEIEQHYQFNILTEK